MMPLINFLASCTTRRIMSLNALIVVAVLLAGCAAAPGMHMGDPEAATQTLEDMAPPGALLTITPDLIREQESRRSIAVRNEVRQLFGIAQAYTVGPGDILNIVVWDHPELAMPPAASSRITGSSNQADIGNGYPVSPEGRIQFPYVGVVKVAGYTESQIRSILTHLLSTYINTPQLSVRVQSYRHRRIYVDGEVRVPGLQVFDDIPMTLPEALNRAGGLTPEADRSSIILTRNGKSIPINLMELSRLGINPNQIMLAKDDMIRVLHSDESKVFVLGEVTRPLAQPLRDGRLSLTEALGEAGGASQLTSNPQQIYIVRRGANDEAKIFHLDAASPAAFLLANKFEMKPRDVVFVDAAAVVRWNRVISNLLPSYGTVISTARAF